MKHKNRLIITLICLFLIICISIIIIPKKNFDNLSGKILFRDPLSDGTKKPDQGLVLLDPLTKVINPIGIHGYNSKFMGSISKILVEKGSGKIGIYDVLTKETKQVYQSENPSTQSYKIGYINEDHFSIVDRGQLILVNINDGSKKVLTEDIGIDIHSWSGDGNTVYYSLYSNNQKDSLYKLNIVTNTKEFLFEGRCPQVSKDGTLIAYIPDYQKSVLKVKQLNGKNEWEYYGPVLKYCFSPNGQYLATVEYWRGFGYYDGYTVKILDYKTGKTQTVVPKYANGQCWDIDWEE